MGGRVRSQGLVYLACFAAIAYTFFTNGARIDDSEKQSRANCVVLSVLLGNRADRDETIKLFDPIRRENPKQFDKLVKRAERGDRRLERVQGDLACDVPASDRSRKTDR